MSAQYVCPTCYWYDEDHEKGCHNEMITCNFDDDDKAGDCSGCIGYVEIKEEIT